jgi:hypothetical protein
MSEKQIKRPRGRPATHVMPERIPDTPESVMRALLAAPPKKPSAWKYVTNTRRGASCNS